MSISVAPATLAVPEYTVAAVGSVVVVVALELLLLRTGLFTRVSYWVALGIMFAFQIPVDGWLTKLSAPIVRYAPEQNSGIRFPWDIPVEDFAFGFALITLTLAVWERLGRRAAGREGTAGSQGVGGWQKPTG